jgi:hypothetical protein
MVLAGCRAKLNHMLLSVLGGTERHITAYQMDMGIVHSVRPSAAE